MPVQVDEQTFCQFKYDPDYLRGYDHLKTPAASCRMQTMPNCRSMDLVLDGGNLVPAPGKMIVTDKILTENPARRKKDTLGLLEKELQAECIIIPAR